MEPSPAAAHASISFERVPILELRDIQLAFDGRVILPYFSITVYEGERLFISGPSGTGKSRLLRAICHLDRFQEGQIYYKGKTLNEVGATYWRRDICYLTDAPTGLSSTPAELYERAVHFRSQCAYRSRKTRSAARQSAPSLNSIISELGLDEALLRQAWHTLSAGQKQRMNLAIGVALAPQVLLLDEPTSHLDAASTARFEALASRLECTVIWVSHSEDQIERLGGRVLSLPEGTVRTMEPTKTYSNDDREPALP